MLHLCFFNVSPSVVLSVKFVIIQKQLAQFFDLASVTVVIFEVSNFDKVCCTVSIGTLCRFNRNSYRVMCGTFTIQHLAT